MDKYEGLIQRCWAQNPESRPTFQEVIGALRDMLSQAIARKGAATSGLRASGGGTGTDSAGPASLGATPADTPHALDSGAEGAATTTSASSLAPEQGSPELGKSVRHRLLLDSTTVRRRMEGMGLNQ